MITYYDVSVSESNEYGYHTGKLTATVTRSTYDEQGKLYQKEYVDNIPVETSDFTEHEAKILFIQNSDRSVSVSVGNK